VLWLTRAVAGAGVAGLGAGLAVVLAGRSAVRWLAVLAVYIIDR